MPGKITTVNNIYYPADFLVNGGPPMPDNVPTIDPQLLQDGCLLPSVPHITIALNGTKWQIIDPTNNVVAEYAANNYYQAINYISDYMQTLYNHTAAQVRQEQQVARDAANQQRKLDIEAKLAPQPYGNPPVYAPTQQQPTTEQLYERAKTHIEAQQESSGQPSSILPQPPQAQPADNATTQTTPPTTNP